MWDLINMQTDLNHVSDRSSHLTGKCRKKLKIFSVRSVTVIYTALHYDVIRDVFVCLHLLEQKLQWFCFILCSQTKKRLAVHFTICILLGSQQKIKWPIILVWFWKRKPNTNKLSHSETICPPPDDHGRSKSVRGWIRSPHSSSGLA